MVNGARMAAVGPAYRGGIVFGNALLTGIVRWIFGDRVSDMLSGYRVFSRRFVKSFPALSSGFETETEFTVHALELQMPIAEQPTAYKERPEGSAFQTADFSRRGAHPAHHRRVDEGRAAVAILRCSGAVPVPARRRGWNTRPARVVQTGLVPRLPTAVWRGAGAALLPFAGLRPSARFRRARPQGDEASRLSRNPRYRLRALRAVSAQEAELAVADRASPRAGMLAEVIHRC